MCVGRYAEKMQWSEAKWNLFEMPAIDMPILCIPAECDNIKLPFGVEIASRWDACLLCDICRHFASVMLHFALLISHNLRCIPAYTHQIPPGFFIVMIRFLIRAFVGFLGELGWGRCFFLVVGCCALHFILYLYAYKRLMTILIYIDVRENLL